MARIMPALEFRSFHSHRSCENVPNTTLFTTLPCADSHPRRGPRSLVALSCLVALSAVPSRKKFALRPRHRAPPFPLCRGNWAGVTRRRPARHAGAPRHVHTHTTYTGHERRPTGSPRFLAATRYMLLLYNGLQLRTVNTILSLSTLSVVCRGLEVVQTVLPLVLHRFIGSSM